MQLDDHRGQLVGHAQAVREQHGLAELGLERLRAFALAVDRGVDQTGRDGVDPDADRRQVAGDRQGHADDAALGRRVRRLADLAVERRDAGHVDDGAALTGVGGSLRLIGVAAMRMQSKVPIRLIVDHLLVQTRGRAPTSNSPSLPMVRCAQPMPAELTSARSGPRSAAVLTASMICSVLVTSTVTKTPPISLARASPFPPEGRR